MSTISKDRLAIAATKKWVRTVVVEYDFCPFARREMERGSISFKASNATTTEDCCAELLNELRIMDSDEKIESTLLILIAGYENFEEYLMVVGSAEDSIEAQGYEGIYQLASFHPDYCFVDSSPDDAANYTNRTPYPMIHILRSASVEEAIVQHPDAESIPQRNIEVARKLGANTLQTLLEQCWFDDNGNQLQCSDDS